MMDRTTDRQTDRLTDGQTNCDTLSSTKPVATAHFQYKFFISLESQ